jgi:chromosome segregation ATPase
MIDNSNENVKLTFEQMQQIDTVQKRLSNIENEVIIAQKNLNVVNKDVLKATREREYQEELISKLNIEIELKTQEKIKLETAVNEMQSYLEEATLKDKELKSEHKTKEIELVQKEHELSEKDKTLCAKEEKLTRQESQFSEEKNIFASKVDKLKEVLPTL